MTTASDLLPAPSASSMLPDVDVGGGDLCADDDDAAGYQAMMSELPTIVSMSGLLDGDFDELNEIQNLLAPPVSDDDEEGQNAAAAAAAEDAYIQAMVPNPIPNSGFSSGMDVSATAAALDENLGFPSTSFVASGYAHHQQQHQTSDSGSVTSTSLSVKAPTKRVHKEVDVGLVTPHGYTPPDKKPKLVSTTGMAQTPAPLRFSSDGVSAPNPLLFGRPIQIPAPSQLPENTEPKKEEQQPTTAKATAPKPKSPIRPTRPPSSRYPPLTALPKMDPPKLRTALNSITPEIISSYPAPVCLTSKLQNKPPPLCKLMFKGKVEPVEGTTNSAIARIPAPPQKIKPADIHPDEEDDDCNVNNTNSATASKKKVGNKAKKTTTKAKKKTGTPKTKKVVSKPDDTKIEDGEAKSVEKGDTVQAPPVVSTETEPVTKKEELIVANPLANVPPAAPIKMLPAPKPKSLPATGAVPSPPLTTNASPPAVVSSNSSAASEDPEDLTGDMETKKPVNNTNSKPLTAEEKAQACRDRNRQHARNTRLRKKAYVEELKRSLMDMVEARDKEIVAANEEKSKKEKLRSNRKRALHDFLQLRGRNEQDEAKWAELVKDSKAFQLTLPVTKFRTTVQENNSSVPEQVLTGVQDIMADTAHFASFLRSLGNTEEKIDETSPVHLQYQCDDNPIVVDGSTGILAWKASTCGAVSQGANKEMQLSGTIHGTFCTETEKLLTAKLLFDTGVIQAQLKHSPHV